MNQNIQGDLQICISVPLHCLLNCLLSTILYLRHFARLKPETLLKVTPSMGVF